MCEHVTRCSVSKVMAPFTLLSLMSSLNLPLLKSQVCFFLDLCLLLTVSFPATPVVEVDKTSRPMEKYVPGAFSQKTKKERSGVPPDITSQAAFPTLSNAAQRYPNDYNIIILKMLSL